MKFHWLPNSDSGQPARTKAPRRSRRHVFGPGLDELENRRLLASVVFADAFGAGRANDVSIEAEAVDPSGNIFITGSFSGTVPFGATSLTSSGQRDIFVAKLDRTGGVLWASRMGSHNTPPFPDDDFGRGLALDPAGDPIVTGFFSGSGDFGSNTLTSSGERDIFVEKLDHATGHVLWANSFGGTGDDLGQSVAIDLQGNAYITGSYQDGASFGPGGVLKAPDSSSTDIFVTKLNSAGTVLWAQSLGGSGTNSGYGIAVDSGSNVYVTGNFTGVAPFGPMTLTSAGDSDVFVTRLNPAGSVVWAISEGGLGHDDGTAIALDTAGNIYTTGDYIGSANFGTKMLTSAGQSDVYVQRLDPSGNVVWAKSFGGTGFDAGFGIAVDGAGNIYNTGVFQGTAQFGSASITSHGDYDVYLTKLDSKGNTIDSLGLGSTAPDQVYQVAVGGPSSVVTLVGDYGAGFCAQDHPLSANGSGYVIQLDQSISMAATHLALAGPQGSVQAGASFGLIVNALNDSGTIDPMFQESVTLSLASNSSGGTLGGMTTVQAINGVASFTGLTIGALGTGDTLTASNDCLNPGTSAPFDVTASRVVTIAIASSSPSSVYGQSLTFTAVVSAATAGGPTPTGSIQFEADGNPFGPAVGLVNGTATSPSLAILGVGSHSIMAIYSGDPSYTGVSCNGPTQLVAPAPAPHATRVSATGHSRKGLTSITLAFDEALAPTSATNSALYSVLSGAKKRGKTIYVKSVPIRGVTYNGNAHTVTILLAHPFKGSVQVKARGGIMAANGAASQGDFTAVVK
jgi:hypothetical protein